MRNLIHYEYLFMTEFRRALLIRSARISVTDLQW